MASKSPQAMSNPSASGSASRPPDRRASSAIEKYSPTDARWKEITSALVQFFTNTPLVIEVLDQPSFREFIAMLDPRYNLPSVNGLLTDLIPEFAKQQRRKIKEELAETVVLCMVANCRCQLGFNCVQIKARYMNDQFELVVKTLGVYRMDTKPKRENMIEFMDLTISLFNIPQGKIVQKCFDDCSECVMEHAQAQAVEDLSTEMKQKMKSCIGAMVQLMLNTEEPSVEKFKPDDKFDEQDMMFQFPINFVLTVYLTDVKNTNFEILDDKFFRHWIKVLNKRYRLPSSEYWFEVVIPAVTDSVSDKVYGDMDEVQSLQGVVGLNNVYGNVLVDLRVVYKSKNGDVKYKFLGAEPVEEGKLPTKKAVDTLCEKLVEKNKLGGKVSVIHQPEWSKLKGDIWHKELEPEFDIDVQMEKLIKAMERTELNNNDVGDEEKKAAEGGEKGATKSVKE